MPFDPNAFLSGQPQPDDADQNGGTATLTAPAPAFPTTKPDDFDADQFLAARSVQGFDPDQWLATHPANPATPVPVAPVSQTVSPLINATRELRGGAAAGVLGIGEGFERSMAGQEAGTPQSVAAGIGKQITDRQQALANFDALPDSLRQTADTSRQRANVQRELTALQTQQQNPRLALPPGTNPGFLTPEYQRARDARTAAADQSADILQSAKDDAGSMFNQDPSQKNTALARVSRSAGETVPLLAASALPGGALLGGGVAGFQAKASAYDSFLADAVKAGQVDATGQPTADAKAQAQQYSDATALRTVPEMAAYLGAGHVAAGVVAKLLSPEAPAAVRALAQAAAAYTSNAAAGTANQVVEQLATGQPIDPSYGLERVAQDGLFSVRPAISAFTAKPPARPEPPVKLPSAERAPGPTETISPAVATDSGQPAVDPKRPNDEQRTAPTTPDEATAAFDPDQFLAATDPNRVPVPPVYAEGGTPQQRASNFLDVDGEAMPTAVHFAPDETAPASLDGLPRVAMPDGSTVVYDPETYQPRDFDTGDGAATPQNPGATDVPEPAPVEPAPEARQREEIHGDDVFTPENGGDDAGEPAGEDLDHDVDLQAEERARREYEAELMSQGQEGIEQSGPELLAAVKDFGGVNPDDPVFAGEIKNLRDASKPAALAGIPGVFNIFKKAAGGLDALTGHLQSLGFPVETPADTLDLLQQRLGQRKPIYGSYVRAEAQSGMAGAEAYARTQRPAPPRTPEELRPLQQQWFAALQRLSPGTAMRLEVVHQQALESLWPNGAPRTQDGGIPHAANLADTIYLSADALRGNDDQVNRVNLLHEIAHSYEASLPVAERQALREQWRREMTSRRSPLHDKAGNLHPDVDRRAETHFSEWLPERLAWENEAHYAARIHPETVAASEVPRTAVSRFAAGLRDLVLRTWKAVHPDAAPSEVSARFRDWLSAGGRAEQRTHDTVAQAALRDWFRKNPKGAQRAGRSEGEDVESGREDVASPTGLDPVTGTRSWLSADGKNDGGSGGAVDAVSPPDGRNPGAPGLEGSARSDARERTGTASGGGGEQQQRVDHAARTRGLAIKGYVGDIAAASLDVGSSGQRGDGESTGTVAQRASRLLRLTPERARSQGYAPKAVEALQRIREQVPLIPRERLVQHIDAQQAARWHGDDESYSTSEGGKARVEHNLKTRTLQQLFGQTQGELRTHLSDIAATQRARGIVPRLELVGVGNEGAAFRDRSSGLIYKFHPGTELASAYGVTRLEGQPDGTTKVSVEKVPLTDAIARYERQNLVSVAIPTEVAGVTPEGILVTKQREMATEPKTTFPEIEQMMQDAGAARLREPNASANRAQSWAVPDGQGNWMVAADLKPDNVLRDRATGEPKLTDGILAPITPEVLRDNPQLADYPATDPEAQFAVRRTLEEQGYRPATDEERKALGIPPAWKNVHVSSDPNARRIAVGTDSKGRTQSRYSTAHTSEAMAQKFSRLQQFDKALPGIMDRVRDGLASGKGREEAAVLRLIHQTGFRNGGDEDTGGKVKAYGASNLRAEHVAFDGDTTHFDFTGKLGVRQQHSVTDPELTADLRQRAAKGGPLFDTNDARVRDFLKQSGDFKVHDFRTWNATDLAAKEVENTPAPTTSEAYWHERDRIGDLAAKKLGDTRKIALESYVNPAVFEPWKNSLGITDENRPSRRSKASTSPAETTAPRSRGATSPADARPLRDDQLSGRPAAGGEAVAALRSARGLRRNGGLSDEHARTLDDTLAQTRPAFERLGFPVRETAHGEGTGLRTGFSDEADTHLGVDRPALARSLAESGLEGPAAHRYITDTIGEEFRHAADVADARERWQSEGAPGQFADFYLQDKARLLQSIQSDMDHLSPASREVAMGAMLDGYNLYHDPFDQGDGQRFENVADLFSHLEDHPEQVPGFMAETLRQLMQAREGNHALTTETGYLSVLDHFRAFVDQMLGRLRLLARSPQTYSPTLADTITRLERATTGTPEPGAPQATVRQTIRSLRGSAESREAKDRIVAGKDAAENRAGIIARQAANGVRLDFGSEKERRDPNSRASKDLAAMPFVIEAGGKRAEVAADLAKVRASANPELAAKYVPVVQHALDHFARLDGLKANYEAITAKQRAIERRHGIDSGEVKNYVTRKLDLPEHQRSLEPVLLGGGPGGASMGSRYFAKGRDFAKLADAIRDGYPPQSTNLADLLEHRVRTGQQLVQQAKLFNELRATKAPGDPAGRTIVGQLEKHTTLGGKDEMRIPAGYDAVSTGSGKPLIVQRQYAGLFGALYGDSAIRNATPGRLILKYAALAKHGTLVFDTFHACRMFAKELSYGYQAGYRRGVSLLEYGDKDLARAVAARDITQAQADYARAQRPQAEALIRAGLNVGKVSDNLAGQVHGVIEKLPGIGKGLSRFNDWVFNKVSRGALLQTALTNYRRNLARFPELGLEGAARRTAREMNEIFGNLGSQGLFKSATMRDLARTVLLAPQWTESQLRAEGRGLGQLARIPLDAARGRFRVGTVAQGMASNVLALLAANQIANYLSRGTSTFQNPEKDHQLDAWIPGGAHGFWFSPFEIAAENLHSLFHYHAQGSGVMEAAGRLAGNKLSPLARGAAEMVTGHNYLGQPFATTGQRIRAGLVDGLPSPLPLSAFLEKDPRGIAGSGPITGIRSAADKVLAPLGYRVNRQPGSLEHQAIQMAGIKTTPAQSAEARMYDLAKPFRKQGAGGSFPASSYTELRRALANDDAPGAQDEIRALVRGGKTVAEISRGMGIHPDCSIPPKLYTGTHAGEQMMLRNLTPEGRDTYHAAQKEHRDMAHRFNQVRAKMDQSDLRMPVTAR